jgi:hypothetical protein
MAEIDELAERYIGWLGRGVKSELQRIGYFDAPASAHHHLAEHGGLLKHSVNVTRWLERLTESIGVTWPRCESIYIVGMLHDVVKAMCYKFQPAGAEEHIVRVPHPYSGHGAASVAIISAELGLPLYAAEASSIMHHMGAFNLQGLDLKDYDNALGIYTKQIIATHTADMLAARFDERNEYARADH